MLFLFICVISFLKLVILYYKMVLHDNGCNNITFYMGSVVSCFRETIMSLFCKQTTSHSDVDSQAQLERKLYLAKESPEPEFDLSGCQLRHVPSGIYSLCKVYRKEYLLLNTNMLKSLEEGGQLSDLYLIKILNISNNKFSKLTSNIKCLINLTELYIQDNFIELIPDSIEMMQCLQILNASKNNLKCLTPSLGKLKNLKKINVKENKYLNELCPELCFATNLTTIELDGEQFTFPPSNIAVMETSQIMKFLCNNMNIEYNPCLDEEGISFIQSPSSAYPNYNPFIKLNVMTWEEQEAAITEQEKKMHKAAQEQRGKFLTTILQEQQQLDAEIAKVHIARDEERQRMIKAIQDNEKDIECIVNNFIMSDGLKPEVIQQQIAYEQAEHERLLEVARLNYDDIKKADVLKAMEMLIEENYSYEHYKRHYDNSLCNVKQNLLMDDLDGREKIADLLKAKDQSRNVLVEQLLEDQDTQKAIVASLLEKLDARSWSLNQEIALISSRLARLSVIEQEKKKLNVLYNYNELLHQRIQLINLLDDLFNQKNKRRTQLIQTMIDMERQTDKTADFWLKNYQKVIDTAPKNLLGLGKSLDPVLANLLLQEGVIHCLPFLVKFLFSSESLLKLDAEQLKENGVSLSSDREGIMRAIHYYVEYKMKDQNTASTAEPTAPILDSEMNCTGVINTNEAKDSLLDSECVICMDATCEVVFVPCGHMCCCQNCADPDLESCPMCRSAIEKKIKVIVA